MGTYLHPLNQSPQCLEALSGAPAGSAKLFAELEKAAGIDDGSLYVGVLTADEYENRMNHFYELIEAPGMEGVTQYYHFYLWGWGKLKQRTWGIIYCEMPALDAAAGRCEDPTLCRRLVAAQGIHLEGNDHTFLDLIGGVTWS